MPETTTQAPTTNTAAKKSGKTFDVVEVTVGEDGTKKFTNKGTVFIRENSSGGVLYLRMGDTKVELALFAKKKRD